MGELVPAPVSPRVPGCTRNKVTRDTDKNGSSSLSSTSTAPITEDEGTSVNVAESFL